MTLTSKDVELYIALQRVKYMENEVKKVKNFICLQCDEVFETENGLKGHNNKKHGGIQSKNPAYGRHQLS